MLGRLLRVCAELSNDEVASKSKVESIFDNFRGTETDTDAVLGEIFEAYPFDMSLGLMGLNEDSQDNFELTINRCGGLLTAMKERDEKEDTGEYAKDLDRFRVIAVDIEERKLSDAKVLSEEEVANIASSRVVSLFLETALRYYDWLDFYTELKSSGRGKKQIVTITLFDDELICKNLIGRLKE